MLIHPAKGRVPLFACVAVLAAAAGAGALLAPTAAFA
jgi:hypothetical protein